MPKYYVQSGQVRAIIDRPSHRSAIISVIKMNYGKGMLTVAKICLSETGWTADLTCYDIDPFLKEIS